MSRKMTADGYKTLIIHYADQLKHVCKSFFGWDGMKDERGRSLLQYVGTDVVRKKEPDFWVTYMSTMLRCFIDNWDYVIIPDVRFPNEITKLRDDGFHVVHLRVVRDNFKSPLSKEQQNHPSETALDNVVPDYVIKNDGDLCELRAEVTTWMEGSLYDKSK